MLNYNEASPEGEAPNNNHKNYSPSKVDFPHWPMHFLSADNLAEFQKILSSGEVKVGLPYSFWTLRFLIGLSEANDVEGKIQIGCYSDKSVTFVLSTRKIINWIFGDNSGPKSRKFKMRLNRFESIRKILNKPYLPFVKTIYLRRSNSYRNNSFIITLQPAFFDLIKEFKKKTNEDGVRIRNNDLKLLEDFSSSEQAFKFIICSIFYIQKNNLERVDLITRSMLSVFTQSKKFELSEIVNQIKSTYFSTNKYPNKPIAITIEDANHNPTQALQSLLTKALTVNSAKSFDLSKNGLRHVNSFITERVDYLRFVDDEYKNGILAFLEKLGNVFEKSFFDKISNKDSPFEKRLLSTISKINIGDRKIPVNSFNAAPQAAQPKEKFTAQVQ